MIVKSLTHSHSQGKGKAAMRREETCARISLSRRPGKQPAEHRFESNCTPHAFIQLCMGAARNPKHAIFHCRGVNLCCTKCICAETFFLFAARNIVRGHAISICSTSCLIRKNWNFACVEITEKLLLSQAIRVVIYFTFEKSQVDLFIS